MALLFTSMLDSTMFLSTLTPKFYVALTGTSSLISGLILIFEWWYFRKYGTSFIEQVSLNHISPWIGGGDSANDNNNSNINGSNGSSNQQNVPECKVWRNPINLFRGAEYQRFYWATNKEPLTYYDMNLSAQDHQTFFTCEGDTGKIKGKHLVVFILKKLIQEYLSYLAKCFITYNYIKNKINTLIFFFQTIKIKYQQV